MTQKMGEGFPVIDHGLVEIPDSTAFQGLMIPPPTG